MELSPFKDRFGFTFWLKWILFFAGSFILSAALWTAALDKIFGAVRGTELTLTWAVCVFGSWFILLIPFMRKKEQIWKRLNEDQEKSVDAWLAGMAAFVGLFIASALVWDIALRNRITADHSGFDPAWAKAVFSTWLVLLIPFLIWMYRQADRIFKEAELRQGGTPRFRTHWIEPQKRKLAPHLAQKIREGKPALPGGHLATAILKNGQERRLLFILNAEEIAGIYDFPEVDFDASDIADLHLHDPAALPQFETEKWVRFNLA